MPHLFISQWVTPTPIPVQTPQFDLNIDPEQFGQDFAGNIIQGWNYFNAQTFSDLVFFVLLVMIVIIGIVIIRNRLEAL